MTFTYMPLEDVQNLTREDPLVQDRVNIFIGRYPQDVGAVTELRDPFTFKEKYMRPPLKFLDQFSYKFRK